MAILHEKSSMVTQPDRELYQIITRTQAGDADAFSDLYRRYASMIMRYLYIRTREPELAQDLTQKVFIRVIRGIGGFQYRGEKSFHGWLYTIAGNILISQARRRGSLAIPLDDHAEMIDPHGQEHVTTLFERLALQQAINQLTEDQQQVLALKFYADMTNQEIAQATGRTEGAVKALQYRALHSLQQILRQTDPASYLRSAPLRSDEVAN